MPRLSYVLTVFVYIFFQALGVSNAKDRDYLKKKVKELKLVLEKERKQIEKERKQMEKEQKQREKEQKKLLSKKK